MTIEWRDALRRLSLVALLVAVGVGAVGCGRGAPARERGQTSDGLEAEVARNFLDEVYAGYQGWFTTPNDGVFNGWFHWAGNRGGQLAPGFDLLPDTSIYPASVLTAAPFAGNHLFYSAVHPDVIETHFRLLEQTHIDGFAVQRFIGDLNDGEANTVVRHRNAVLRSVRTMAEKHRRKFYVMYDVSGGKADWVQTIKDDFTNVLRDEMGLFESSSYARQNGRPVVTLWGVGFTDRPGTAQETQDLIDWFRREQNVFLVGGVPSRWRDGAGDSKPGFKKAYLSFDVIQPWTVGRFRSEAEASRFYSSTVDADITEARRAGVAYQTVIFPGFSWKNLLSNNNMSATLNEIPRNGGRFMWTQGQLAAQRGMTSFVAMFDEYDEGTAIAPAASSKSEIPAGYDFLTLDADGIEMTSDFYVRLTSEIAEMQKTRAPRANFNTPHRGEPLIKSRTASRAGEDSVYEIVATHSGKCMALAGSGSNAGDVLQQWSCSGSAGSQWRLHAAGDDTFTIESVATGQCLDVIDNALADDAQLQQWPCIPGAANQRWRLVQINGLHQIVSMLSGKCMSVANGSELDGGRVRQWECVDKPNFLFELRRAN
jgi:hypothetical protein